MTGVRISADLEAAILNWAKLQSDKPSKAEAIRRLVEKALSKKALRVPTGKVEKLSTRGRRRPR